MCSVGVLWTDTVRQMAVIYSFPPCYMDDGCFLGQMRLGQMLTALGRKVQGSPLESGVGMNSATV